MAEDEHQIIEIDESDEGEDYVVEAIRAWRYDAGERKMKYLIKWKNWTEDDNTWEPEENLDNCRHILVQYRTSLKGKDLEYYNHSNPDELNGFQRHARYIDCVGVEGPHESDLDEDSDKPERQRFYCLVRFDDDAKRAEEITLSELFDNMPDEAFKFCERRLFAKKKKKKMRQDAYAR